MRGPGIRSLFAKPSFWMIKGGLTGFTKKIILVNKVKLQENPTL
jgi:hypothetical protein